MRNLPYLAGLVLVLGAVLSAGYHTLIQGQVDAGAGRFKPVELGENAARAPGAALTSGFIFPESPAVVPELTFVDASGKQYSLSDFRGRAVILNIWATWCVPCRREMPSLDRLQARFDPAKLLVVALTADNAAQVSRFYDDFGVHALGTYVYTGGGAASQLGLPGVPGTLLIDAEGHEVARKLGPAEWDSEAVVDLLRRRLDLPS